MSIEELVGILDDWIYWYNEKRSKESFGGGVIFFATGGRWGEEHGYIFEKV